MPELPDLEVFSHNLNRQLKGLAVEKVIVKNQKKINVTGEELIDALEKQKISKIYRSGKELYIEFEKKITLSLHLMLNGELHLLQDEDLPKYSILALLFENGSSLILSDFRGLAKVTLHPEEGEAPDALAPEVDQHFLEKTFAKKKAIIKNILLDQKIIRGIGNAYADEILWKAGISPFSAANKIPVAKLKDLSKAIHDVLTNAVKQISAHHPNLISGEIRDFLTIHNPKKSQSPSGVTIKIKKTGARKTYYTDEQQLFV